MSLEEQCYTICLWSQFISSVIMLAILLKILINQNRIFLFPIKLKITRY